MNKPRGFLRIYFMYILFLSAFFIIGTTFVSDFKKVIELESYFDRINRPHYYPLPWDDFDEACGKGDFRCEKRNAINRTRVSDTLEQNRKQRTNYWQSIYEYTLIFFILAPTPVIFYIAVIYVIRGFKD